MLTGNDLVAAPRPSPGQADPAPSLAVAFGLVVLASIPFWTLGGLDADLVLSGRLPPSALMFVVPALVAILLSYLGHGWAGVKRLIGRLVPRARPPSWPWWVAAGAVMPLVLAIAWLLRRPGIAIGVSAVDASVLFAGFLVAAACEELGWTAYATDDAVARFGHLRAGLGIGAVWAAWHLLPWAQTGHGWWWILWQCAATVAMRVIMVVIYLRSGRQVFATLLFHATINLGLVPSHPDFYDPFTVALVLAPLAAWAGVGFGSHQPGTAFPAR